MPFQRRLLVSPAGSVGSQACVPPAHAPPLGEPSERKTCLQVAFLMGVPVKVAFALLLTKVTKPENVEIYRWEMKKCRER